MSEPILNDIQRQCASLPISRINGLTNTVLEFNKIQFGSKFPLNHSHVVNIRQLLAQKTLIYRFRSRFHVHYSHCYKAKLHLSQVKRVKKGVFGRL